MYLWNLIHGCHRKSEGCRHCYVFSRDEEHGIDTNVVRKTASFSLPMKRNRRGEWKIPAGATVMTCFSSDFFIEEMDAWREDAWQMMRTRNDLFFYIVTKRPERINLCLPSFWGEVKERVTICCTMENQRRADERLPIFRKAPILHKEIIAEPMLESINFHGSLEGIEQITVGGESGKGARPCHYEWVLNVRKQCVEADIGFYFMQTGGNFVKDNHTYRLPHHVQTQQAKKANINVNHEH